MTTESDEVAEDYRLALEDLSGNLRHEISTLTMIARENTEHALAIAEVLQQHILKAPPSKKLPALYLLDSIVKNVGTPYTLYFGRNLFKTFMESYAVVDHNIRRKMEEMLKTWKEPVVGALDTRPPFSPELVRPIENALMKVRAASMPAAPFGVRSRNVMAPNRNTPTPPVMRPGAPPGQFPQGYPANGAHYGGPTPGYHGYPGQPPQQGTPQPPGAAFQAPLAGLYGALGAAPSAGISVDNLSNDIQTLIVAMQADFAQSPQDHGMQTRLKALLDLQTVVKSTNLPQDQLELIRNRVNQLAAVTMRAPSAQNSTPFPPPVSPHQPPPRPASVTPAPPVLPAAAQPPKAPVSLDSLLGQGALATLMARQSATPQASTPQPPPPVNIPIRSPQPAFAEPPKAPVPAPAAAFVPSGQNPSSLLDQLRAAGLLPATAPSSASTPVPSAPTAPAPAPATLPPNLADLLASARNAMAKPTGSGIDVVALKTKVNPQAIGNLYDNLGPPCTQCGRRFRTDEEGRRKKTAHMDWHFHVHQRSTESERRGLHRSWYVDQQDWLKSREAVDAIHVTTAEDAAAEATKAAEAAKPKYIAVPDPTRGINTVCPICQERFENKWLDTAQEWVWLDAVLVGGNKAYHASCHAEATRDREGTPGPGVSRKSPEPVLGKRKAEVSISSPKVRSLKTSA